MSYKSKSVAIYDNGLFVELAATLVKDFGNVFYYSPWKSGFPKSNGKLVGTGLPGVTRIDDFWAIKNEVDLFVFPDIYDADVQLELEGQGKRVFGSRAGDILELQRDKTKHYIRALGLPVGKWTKVKGLQALRTYLKSNPNQWVKINTTRGDMETFFAKNYKLIEPKLDELEHTLGAKKLVMDFIVEEDLANTCDLSYDGYTIDGQFPSKAMLGVEIKDKGYIGVFKNYENFPKVIKEFNTAISPFLKEKRYRNFFSPEMRIAKDGKGYMNDPCCRFGSPPSEVGLVIYKNLADILWNGAEGICIDPIPTGEFAVELLIHSSWADKNWQALSFPPEFRDNIKLRNLAIIEGKYYVVPQSVGLPEIGAVVATGKSFKEAANKCVECSKKIEGYYIEIYTDALDKVQEEVANLESCGISL
jgi:hypothetical protein